MKLQLTRTTKIKDFPFYEELSDEQKNKLLESSTFDYGKLTVSDLFDMAEGKVPSKLSALITEDITVVDYIALTYGLQKFVEWYTKEIETYTVKPTAEETAAAAGVVKPTYQESILFMLRSYFDARSFAEVEQLTLTDYLLASKDTFIKMTLERNLGEIYKRKTQKNIKR